MWAAQSNQSKHPGAADIRYRLRDLQMSKPCGLASSMPTGVSTETPFPSFITVFFSRLHGIRVLRAYLGDGDDSVELCDKSEELEDHRTESRTPEEVERIVSEEVSGAMRHENDTKVT